MEEQRLYATIPRMNGKRVTLLMSAIQKAKEGYTVYVADLGEGQDIIFKPVEKRQKDDEKIVGRRLTDLESMRIMFQDPPVIDGMVNWKLGRLRK